MNIWSFCCLHPAHWEITHNKRISSRQQGTVSSQSTETISVYFSSSLRLRVVILSLQDNSALKWRKWLKSSQNPDFDLKHLCPHTVLSQQCVFVREKKRENPSARPGTDNMLSAHRRTGMRMRKEVWHFTAWHFLNVTYCSQRILPPLTFHSSFLSLFDVADAAAAAKPVPSVIKKSTATVVLPDCGLFTSGSPVRWCWPVKVTSHCEGRVLEETGWSLPAECDLISPQTSSIIPLSFVFVFCCLSSSWSLSLCVSVCYFLFHPLLQLITF